MSAKHTPGPWRVFEDRREECSQSYVAGYNIESDHGEIVGIEGICCTESDEANARLIAAATDLLEACQGIVAAAENGLSFGLAIEYARAAIAKATGESA